MTSVVEVLRLARELFAGAPSLRCQSRGRFAC